MEKYPDHLCHHQRRGPDKGKRPAKMARCSGEMLENAQTANDRFLDDKYPQGFGGAAPFLPAKACPKPQSMFCRNLFLGKLSSLKFTILPKAREKVEGQGKTLDFPVLSPRVATALYSRRQPIKTAYEQMRISERVELSRWKKPVREMLKQIFENQKS